MNLDSDQGSVRNAVVWTEDCDDEIAEWTLDELDHDFGRLRSTWTFADDRDA